ncbi:MAG: flavodoxin family protein [Candidatus Pacebacteria bacterium]|nr:flavodoxin family protein [Candidatus Paceibacterota bacterium]
MKTLIIYTSTHSGNTEKVAKAIAEELSADLVRASELKNYDVKEYDLIGLGSGIYMGKHHISILDIAGKLKNVENKRFFIFSTSGIKELSFNNFNKDLKEVILKRSVRLIDSFNCRGYSNYGLTKLFGGINKNRPNEQDLEKAKEFAKTLKPKPLTLCLTLDGDRILLGMKKRGFGEGRWNGFGGKLELGETLIEGAKREMLEESGLHAEGLEEIGSIEFDFLDNNKFLNVHFFNVLKYSGEPIETEEMKPEWFNVNDIPFDKMWPDDQLWIPLYLEKKKFLGKILFRNVNEIISDDIKII